MRLGTQGMRKSQTDAPEALSPDNRIETARPEGPVT